MFTQIWNLLLSTHEENESVRQTVAVVVVVVHSFEPNVFSFVNYTVLVYFPKTTKVPTVQALANNYCTH